MMRFVAAHRSIIDYAVSGTVDTGYDEDWLTTASTGYPVRVTGSVSLTVASVGSVDSIAVVSHNIVAAATVSATSFGTIPTSAARGDSIPWNYGVALSSPVTPGSMTLSVTGNTGVTVIGMLYAGLSYRFNGWLHGVSFSPEEPFPWEGEFSSLAPYDMGLASQRRRSGTIVIDDTSYNELLLTFESQRRGSLPLLWWEEETINDPWLVQLTLEEEHSEGWHHCNLQISEIPRLRWPS